MIRKNICHQAIFYPKQVYKKFSYDQRYPILSDYEYNLRLMGSGYMFNYFDGLVAIFSNDGISSGGDKIFKKNKLKLILNYFGLTYAIFFMLCEAASLICKIPVIKKLIKVLIR
jgi:hypothetical protein